MPAAKRRSSTKRQSSGKRTPAPQALTLGRFARVVKENLAGVQARLADLDLTQQMNGCEDTDQIPGVYERDGDGVVTYPTYDERRALLKAQETRLIEQAEKRPGTLELVEKLVAADEAMEAAELAAAIADAAG